MIVKKIRLVNFRNHEEFELAFNKKTTVITGGNGWGKTSVLEAVCLGLRGKSFRGVDDEMMRRGAEFYRVDLALANKNTVVVRYGAGRRSFEVGGRRSARLPRASKYPVVLFLPSDLHLISSSPTRRRDYFDGVVSGLDEGFGSALLKYNRALRQRNEALKCAGVARGDVFAWDVMLAKYGVEVESGRRRLLAEMNRRIDGVYAKIADTGDECRLELRGVEVDENGYIEALARCWGSDAAVGHTTFGVHRDDWEFLFNSREADGNASRGETRSFVLAMKFIEAAMLEEAAHKKPLVLLDDVLSELDGVRQAREMQNFGENQVIMTSTSIEKAGR